MGSCNTRRVPEQSVRPGSPRSEGMTYSGGARSHAKGQKRRGRRTLATLSISGLCASEDQQEKKHVYR